MCVCVYVTIALEPIKVNSKRFKFPSPRLLSAILLSVSTRIRQNCVNPSRSKFTIRFAFITPPLPPPAQLVRNFPSPEKWRRRTLHLKKNISPNLEIVGIFATMIEIMAGKRREKGDGGKWKRTILRMERFE